VPACVGGTAAARPHPPAPQRVCRRLDPQGHITMFGTPRIPTRMSPRACPGPHRPPAPSPCGTARGSRSHCPVTRATFPGSGPGPLLAKATTPDEIDRRVEGWHNGAGARAVSLGVMNQTYTDALDALDWAAFRTTASVDGGPSGCLPHSLRQPMAAPDAQAARGFGNTALEVAATSCPKPSRPEAWSCDGGLVRVASAQ
jgi:hypothetical protein